MLPPPRLNAMKWLTLLAAIAAFCTTLAYAATQPDADQKGPVFLNEPTNRIDFSNSTGAEIECKASGNPMPEIIWIRSDGTAVGDVPGLRQISSDGKLVFPPFRAEDYRQEVHAQVYACLARNQFGTIISRDVHVRAVVPQSYTVNVMDEAVLRGNSAILKCHIPSFVADFISVASWVEDEEREIFTTNDGVGHFDSDGKYLVLPSGELHIREVGPEDGYKSYQCRTKHRLTGETRLSATKGRLVITEPVGSVKPKINVQDKLQTREIASGVGFALLCPAQSYPTPAHRWYKFIEGTTRKQAVILNERVKQVSGTLIIKDAVVEDSGKYLCVVNNSVGGESVETVLTVTAPLSAKIDPPTQTIDFGRPAVFTCQYSGNPIKTISWLKDGKSIGHSDQVLRIESVKKEDKGMYQCFVRNDQESAEASAELKLGGRFDPPVIRQAFQEETMEPGPSVFLKCVAGGNPTPEISWELDGKKIANIDRYQVGQYVTVNGDVVSYLNITSVHANDGGLYKCIAKSKVGVAEHSAKLNVYGLPYIRQMEKKAIVAGETLIVTCPVAGYPIDSIVWERDNRALPINRKQKVFPNGTLIIENVERNSDQATYTCVAKNAEGYSARGSLEVQVMVLPQITPFSYDDIINTGDSIDLLCQIQKGDRPIKINWSFERAAGDARYDTLQPIMRTNRFSSKSSVLSIPRATPAHTGTYTCTASNEAGSTTYSTNITVNVPPRWILEPTDKAFAQGSDAKVECKADGFPKPQVTWKKAVGDTPGEYKDLKKNDNIRVEEGTLHIDNIQKTNEGYYLCEAINGIGSGLSAVIMISVQAPPEFTEKLRNQTARRGEPAVLQCEAKGEKPIGILWNMNNVRLDPKNDNRYTIREEILSTGVMSSLSIKRTERSDSALFTCLATNAFGSDDASINMIIQEVPEMPYALKVLDKSGRSVQLSWAQPYDGNSPLIRYIIEFKRSRASWDEVDRVMVPGHTTEAQVQKLSPATTYNIRIVAENAIGTSQSSEAVTIITAEEAPSGKPQNIKVEPVNQTTLRVTWKPPARSEWNGEILGYYVGYKLSNTNSSYVFETVNFLTEEGKEHSLELNNLRVYTQYSVVIQAFNKIGAGPLSDEEKQFTAEGTPSQPPSDTACTTLTSQTIRVSWVSPPLESANGVIKTYKVVYAPSDEWYDDTKRHYKKTASSDTVLHGLKKFTNYTMQVLATTAGGDGVRSAPIHCQTEPDVPEAPTDVKALVKGHAAILVSWRPPAQPNGIIQQYTVYSKVEGAEGEPKSQKIPQHQMSFEAVDLEKNKPYEFWVTASTNIGEGQQSKSIVAMPSDQVPAKIASFDDTFTATFKEDAKMPCLAVGSPQPEITWKVKGVEFTSNDRMRVMADGTLLIKTVNRQDAGEYSCHAENSIAKDSITHKLIVLAPPQSPQVSLSATTTDSLTVKVKPHEGDTAPLHGYTLHYKPEFGEWETAEVSVDAQKFTIENLLCGSRYQVYATGFNNIGAGEASDILNTRTKGYKPKLPEKQRFIEVSSNSVSLHFKAWKDGGCPMSHFVVENKKREHAEWNQISNNVKPDNNYVVLDLEPATWYNLRITAHNSAGFTVAEYDFATLTVTGGTIAPSRDLPELTAEDTIRIILSNLNLVVPVVAALLVIIIAIIVICVLRSKGNHHKDDVVYNQTMGPGATLDKRRPDLRDELGYIAPPNRKLPPVPGSNYNTCDRIKRARGIRSNHSTWDPRRTNLYEELKAPPVPLHGNHYGPEDVQCHYRHPGMEDEICPYATFHLLGFREEMDPTKAMNFQTFPHQNGHAPGPGHAGTMGPPGHPGHVHSRSGSQSMPRANRYARKNSQGGQSSIYTPAPEYDDPANCAEEDQYRRYTRVNSQGGSLYSGPGPEYDDPANCAPEEDQYGSQYGGPYGTPYDHYGSRGSMGRRSVGSARNPGNGSPEPPPPPPRNHDMSNSSFNDSKESNEISEAECDRDHGPRGNYGAEDSNEAVKRSPLQKDQRTTEEMRKLIESRRPLNEAGPKQLQQQSGAGFTAYDTMAV
ncbi:Down syndrome cell adhesion molecule-like protein Dscam2 isoform X39 [Bactrocera dorsalis]|uniref:Down syndrome cell adhesion molecule-like protein Dscam2 isoform X39 n=1 Tax=Bactrocera dorsalis TaxID=27457 RepID=A0ABM3JJ41_BACDO|nr:Down syndrome cell adhesion molecule-like protein Dscam2 isoform X39 [Bactrocera dorsalis]